MTLNGNLKKFNGTSNGDKIPFASDALKPIDIFSEYHTLQRLQKQCVHAVLEYVTPLTETQLSAMKKMICVKTGKPEVELELQENPDLHGGFVLHIGDEVYDRSLRGIIRNMRKSLIRR